MLRATYVGMVKKAEDLSTGLGWRSSRISQHAVWLVGESDCDAGRYIVDAVYTKTKQMRQERFSVGTLLGRDSIS